MATRIGRLASQSYTTSPGHHRRVHPNALDVLSWAGIDTSGHRSKSCDEFSGPDAPGVHIVITICDRASVEHCPYWPGIPVQVHWDYPDPADTPEAQRARDFELTRRAIGYHMPQLALLPVDTLSPVRPRCALDISKN